MAATGKMLATHLSNTNLNAIYSLHELHLNSHIVTLKSPFPSKKFHESFQRSHCQQFGPSQYLSKPNIRTRNFIFKASGRDVSSVESMAADAENYSDGMAASISNPALDLGLEEIADVDVTKEPSPEYTSWNTVTESLTLSSTFAGLFLMAPQIWKNVQYLSVGQLEALRILPWAGYSTGFLGNMLLLSYFASKRELSATLVQAVGATSTCILLSQIYLAGFMPPLAFFSVFSFLIAGLCVNSLEYLKVLPRTFWATWQDFIGVVGLAVLPQVIWQTFSSIPTRIPGLLSVSFGIFFVIALRLGKVPKKFRNIWEKLGGWTATLLFMFMPVAQLQACFTNPESLAGISVLSPIMGIIANGLMIPRALFTRDLMWFTGATWGALMMGWAVFLSMFLNSVINPTLFFSVTLILLTYLGSVLFKDSKAHDLTSPLSSLKSFFSGDSS